MKDHEVAIIVNLLRDETKMYADTQQLRARIAGIIVPLLRDKDPVFYGLIRSMKHVCEWMLNYEQSSAFARNEARIMLEKIEALLSGEVVSTEVLSEVDITHLVEEMPGGVTGYLKSWGWLNFARRVEKAVLERGTVPEPDMYCKACNCPRKGTKCWKCESELFKPSVEWEHPALPAVEPIRLYARDIGYAITEHGSKERDLDLVAVPWTAEAADYKPHQVADYLAERINARVLNPDGEVKPHGRVAFTLQIDGWFRHIDLSVMSAEQEQNHDEHF